MTPLEHTDAILAAAPGTWLRTTDEISASPRDGGMIHLPAGTRLRVKHALGDMLDVYHEDARSFTIWRHSLVSVEIEDDA